MGWHESVLVGQCREQVHSGSAGAGEGAAQGFPSTATAGGVSAVVVIQPLIAAPRLSPLLLESTRRFVRGDVPVTAGVEPGPEPGLPPAGVRRRLIPRSR